MRYCLLFIASYLYLATAHGQWSDSLAIKMANYEINKKADLLFVHTDKHIYTNNETIWFSVYLLQCGADSLPMHRFVSVALVHAGNRDLLLQQKFVMAQGLAAGSLPLPDSIPPGEYQLLVYTNVMDSGGSPVALSTQPLLVRSIRNAAFNAVLTVDEEAGGGRQLKVLVSELSSGIPVPQAELLVSIGSEPAFAGKTDKKGLFTYSLLPAAIMDTADLPIQVRVRYQGDLMHLQKTMPAVTREQPLVLHFYPEGGHLLSAMPGRVGWEANTLSGAPLAISAVLMENGLPIDTISTNDKGLGVFSLVPRAGAAYEVRPLQLPAGIGLRQKSWSLATIESQGITLSVPQAIARDSLRFHVYAAGYSRVKMVVHNFNDVFITAELDMALPNQEILLLLEGMPKGLLAITLLDSLERPFAERIIFAHHDKKITVETGLDKAVYATRQQVTLTMHLDNGSVYGDNIASVACAQANRFQSAKQQDIEAFVFLQAELQRLPVYVNGSMYDDTGYLETLLLVKGWRRYTWQEMAANASQLSKFTSPVFRGRIKGHKIKRPVLLTLIGGTEHLSVLATDSSGHITLTDEQMVVGADRKLWIAPAGKNGTGENFELLDPYPAINERLAAALPFVRYDPMKYTQALDVKEFPAAQALRTVVVTARKDRTIYGAANRCGDFVCLYNILNCPNHYGNPGNHMPEKGRTYMVPGGGTTVYWGCRLDDPANSAIYVYDGIRVGKTFYGEDYSEKSMNNAEYVSTLYWSPSVHFDAHGQAVCTFYTSDITGRFRVEINGRTNDDVFHGTAYFEVK